MPVIQGNGDPTLDPTGQPHFHRKLFVTDKNGVEHEIVTQKDLLDILAQMTPEQRKDWEARYRFAPIENLTGNPNYTGTGWDLL